jgi:hypothetical protein
MTSTSGVVLISDIGFSSPAPSDPTFIAILNASCQILKNS